MKTLALVSLLLISAPAFAHLNKGPYVGTTEDGKACGFEVLDVQFDGGVRHPLNERVQVEVDGTRFELRHLPRLDVQTGAIEFDGAHLSGAFATAQGKFAAVLWMDHSEGFDGPRVLNIMHQATGHQMKIVCSSLRKGE